MPWCMQMKLVLASNVLGIESRPFDPDSYEDRDANLVQNIARWRRVQGPDGSTKVGHPPCTTWARPLSAQGHLGVTRCEPIYTAGCWHGGVRYWRFLRRSLGCFTCCAPGCN